MIRLIRIEFLRLWSRRLTRVGILLAIALSAVAGVIAAATSKQPSPLSLVEVADVLPGVSPFYMIGALVVGASFLGADWSAGTIATQLTWEPRRLRVLVAKVIALAIGVFVLAVVLEAVLVAFLAAAAAINGVTDGVDGTWLSDIGETLIRAGAVCSIGALIAMSIAMVSRTTAAALGIAFAWLAVAEGLIRGLKPSLQPWLIGENIAIFLIGFNDGVIPGSGRTATTAGLQLLLYAAIGVVIAGAWFSRRDVT
ncbi:MAG: hypothetical protein WEA10_05720 [Actinomycetota bacterium]